MKFKKGEQIYTCVIDPFTLSPKGFYKAVVVKLAKEFTNEKNDGTEYYVVNLYGLKQDKQEPSVFISRSNNMFRENEKLPDSNEIVERIKNEMLLKSK